MSTFQAELNRSGKRLSDVAKALGTSRSTVTRWCQGRIPVDRVFDVERVTGISRVVLRPDLFGSPPAMPDTPAQAAE